MCLPQSVVDIFWAQSLNPPFRGMPNGFVERQSRSFTNFAGSQQQALRMRVVGGATRHAVEDLFHPASYRQQPRLNRNGGRTVRRGSGAGRARIFLGRNWERITVVAFESEPEVICGFAFLDDDQGQTAEQLATPPVVQPLFPHRWPAAEYGAWAAEDAIIFKTVGPARRKPVEAGLAMLTVASSNTTSFFPDQLFVFLDLVLALDLQLKWCQTWMNPLPLLVARDDPRFRTVTAWQHKPASKRTILLAHRAEPRVFRQAQLAGADVFIDSDLTKHVRQAFHTQDVLYRASKQAKPWPDALRQTLYGLQPEAAAEFLDEVELPPAAWTKFLNQCQKPVLDHLRKSSQAKRYAPRVNVNDEVVLEQDSGWFAHSSGAKIFDRVQIDKTLCKQDGTSWLQGRLWMAGKPQGFLVPQQQAETTSLPAALRQFFHSQRLELECQHGWSREILPMALSLHPPATVKHADAVGWQDGVIRFPSFGLDCQGFRSELKLPLVDDQTPCKKLHPPNVITKRDVRPITLDSPEVNRFWAVILTAAYSILTPAIYRPPIGVVLAGSDALPLADAIAEVFDCRQIAAPWRAHARRAYRKLNEQLTMARWPIVVRPRVKEFDAMRQMLGQLTPANCFVPATDILLAPQPEPKAGMSSSRKTPQTP